jgi:Tripartite tricarboxylate transporter TctB family
MSGKAWLRVDHVAGALFFLLGVLVFAISGDLPFGRLAAPGAGMLPKLMAGLMMAFSVLIAWRARSSPAWTSLDWGDGRHAILVLIVTALAILAYRPLGFLLAMPALVFGLLVVVERRRPLPAALYALSLTFAAYWLFAKALKSPLERGLVWF